MLIWIAAISVTLFALAGIVTFVALGQDDGGDRAAVPAALTDAGCDVTRYPGQPPTHVEELEEGFEYNSNPPSSGPHSGQQPIFGIYTDPVEPLYYLHGLEHGGVAIQYGDDVPEDQISALSAWYQDEPNGLIVSPRPQLPQRTVALVAWNAESARDRGEGIVAACPRFDETAFDAFVEEYGFKGPESDHGDGLGFTRDDLTPGA
jgi:hypothetical protein